MNFWVKGICLSQYPPLVILIGSSRLLAALHLDWIDGIQAAAAGLGAGGHEVFGCKCIIICTDPHTALGPAVGSEHTNNAAPSDTRIHTQCRPQEKVEAGWLRIWTFVHAPSTFWFSNLRFTTYQCSVPFLIIFPVLHSGAVQCFSSFGNLFGSCLHNNTSFLTLMQIFRQSTSG